MRTFPRAKANQMNTAYDGAEIFGANIEVIDLDTGKPPVDELGCELHFVTVDAEIGVGFAYDTTQRDRTTIEVRRRFELREVADSSAERPYFELGEIVP